MNRATRYALGWPPLDTKSHPLRNQQTRRQTAFVRQAFGINATGNGTPEHLTEWAGDFPRNGWVRHAAGALRNINMRATGESNTNLYYSRDGYLRAAAGQIIGVEMRDNEACTACIRGRGPFQECVVVLKSNRSTHDDIERQACMNCWYKEDTIKTCSFRSKWCFLSLELVPMKRRIC